MFSIDFLPTETPLEIPNAKIVVEDFEEYLDIGTDYWDKKQFKSHWQERIGTFLSKNIDVALMVDMSNISNAQALECWELYHDKDNTDKVYVQNTLVLSDSIRKYNDENAFLQRLAARETVNEDGVVISEWVTSKNSLNDFLKTL